MPAAEIAKLRSVRHYNGLPIDARSITDEIIFAGGQVNGDARRLQLPAPKTNRIGLAVLDYRGGKTTLCAGCGHNAISERIIDAFYEMGIAARARDQDVGHRLLVQEPGLLHEPLAQLQLRAWTHAVGGHRRGAGQLAA